MTSGSPYLLSIVVPTLNRRALLEETLKHLILQIDHHRDVVELVLVDNASTDSTAELFRRTSEEYPWIRTVVFEERAEIDESFARCVLNSTGSYINIFGDDDIPLPGYIEKLLAILNSECDVDIVYVNRLIGDADLMSISGPYHPSSGYKDLQLDKSDFIRAFRQGPAFITSLTFSRNVWESGASHFLERYQGYKFLARLYFSSIVCKCIYVGFPLLIQRIGRQSWIHHWPRYWLQSFPSLLHDLEVAGETRNALSQWQSELSSAEVLKLGLMAKVYGYSPLDSFWDDAGQFLHGPHRFLFDSLARLVPNGLAVAAYKWRRSVRG